MHDLHTLQALNERAAENYNVARLRSEGCHVVVLKSGLTVMGFAAFSGAGAETYAQEFARTYTGINPANTCGLLRPTTVNANGALSSAGGEALGVEHVDGISAA